MISEEDIDCVGSEFKCDSNKRCLPTKLKCDGKYDCEDGSDEKHCPTGDF